MLPDLHMSAMEMYLLVFLINFQMSTFLIQNYFNKLAANLLS